jgi:hypothetical protein
MAPGSAASTSSRDPSSRPRPSTGIGRAPTTSDAVPAESVGRASPLRASLMTPVSGAGCGSVTGARGGSGGGVTGGRGGGLGRTSAERGLGLSLAALGDSARPAERVGRNGLFGARAVTVVRSLAGAPASPGGSVMAPGASAVLGRSLAAAPVSGGAGASAAAGGVPSAPADGRLEGNRLSEGRSGTAPTWVLPPAALLVTGRMVERAFRLTTDESRDRRRAGPPSPATTHNTTTMATQNQPRFAFRRPRLRSGDGVVS